MGLVISPGNCVWFMVYVPWAGMHICRTRKFYHIFFNRFRKVICVTSKHPVCLVPSNRLKHALQNLMHVCGKQSTVGVGHRKWRVKVNDY